MWRWVAELHNDKWLVFRVTIAEQHKWRGDVDELCGAGFATSPPQLQSSEFVNMEGTGRSSGSLGCTYAGDDPVNSSDPTGLETVGLCGSISVGAGTFRQVFNAVGLGLLTSTAASGSICEVHTVDVPADEWALTATAGFSYNKTFGAWAGISGSIQLSTASHVHSR